MAKNILIATPQPAFGEFLRLSLEESGRYRVRLVQVGREVLSSVEQNLYSLVILDAALLDPPFAYVVQGLRARSPAMRLLVIPPAEGPEAPEIRAARPDGCISQPFYTPSLLKTIDRLTAETLQPAAVPPPAALAPPQGTLADSHQVSGILEEFLKDSTAPAVLVLRAGQPWAWAGQLNPAALDEVAQRLARYAAAQEGVDLARFVHLQADGGEYLLYATPLTDGPVLVMIYQVTTPLTVIRAQAMRLAHLLRQPAAMPVTAPQPVLLPVPVIPSQAPATAPTPAAFSPADGDEDEAESDDARLEADARRLIHLLAEMPDPNPAPPEPSDWVREEAPADGDDSFLFPWERRQNPAEPAAPVLTLPTTLNLTKARPLAPEGGISAPDPAAPTAVENVAASEFPEVLLTEETEADQLAETALDAEGELADSTVPMHTSLPQVTLPDWLTSMPPVTGEDTRPVVLRTLQSLQQVQPIMPSFSHLAYTCLLIPRLPGHNLIGPLAERLKEWLPQLCLAYGWRLENLFVRPDYLQWTVQVAPAISPGNVLRLIRQQASRRIFLQFPQYEIENPSGDFWAPGFLIISGFQPPSIHLVQDFIQQTRTRQGSWTH